MENKYIIALKEIDKIIIDNLSDNTDYSVRIIYYEIQNIIEKVLING